MKQSVKVAQVASWDGWCSPCQREDRPLMLTRSGPAGLLAWLSGLGDDDRVLLLTCRVCGQWQVVPRHEEDDPEVVLVDDTVVEAVAAIVTEAVAEPVTAPVPAPRTEHSVLLRGLVGGVPDVSAPRRPERSTSAVRVPRPRVATAPPAPTSLALPSDTVLDLLASGHQVVLAQGS